MKLILFIAFSFFLPFALHADSSIIRINLINNSALQDAEFVTFSRDLRRYLRANIDTRIRTRRSIDKVKPPLDLDPNMRILDLPSTSLTHYLFPQTDKYIYGWGWTCSQAPKQNSYSTYKPTRYYESLTAAAHEIAHQLGAKHRSGLMHPNALAIASAEQSIPLPIAATLKDIYKCGNFISKPSSVKKR